jgi:conjugative relaxase-like TrwC/TraI family protein
VVAVISVAMLGGGGDAAAYYLDRGADCEEMARYYTSDAAVAERSGADLEVEPAGRWCGQGTAGLDLSGPIGGDDAAVFAGLLDGRLPDGQVVARPVLRADPRGLLPAAPLMRELSRLAGGSRDIRTLVPEGRLGAEAARLIGHADSPTAGRATIDARLVAELSDALGLNPHVLYPGSSRRPSFAEAFRVAGSKVDTRRSGLDVVVSAPKSVSVLFALAEPAVARTVLAAHEHAVREALGYLERHTSHAMRGHQGGGQRAGRIDTEGFVGAAFTHHRSREDDPQLHTHLVIANVLHGVDGKWSAVDSRAVYRHARTAGCIYQAVLRGELTRQLGLSWDPISKGVAEIRGIPRVVLRSFSRRREAIEAELDRTGGSGRRAAQRAAYRTRPAKSSRGVGSLRQRWAERTRELGHDPSRLVQQVLQRQHVPALPDHSDIAHQLLGPHGLTERATSFDRRDVIQTLTESLPAGIVLTGQQWEAAADRMLRAPDAVRLLRPQDSSGARWTAAELLATEHKAITLAATPSNVPTYQRQHAREFAASHPISDEQRELVAELLQSPATVDIVVGPAGSGKTALLRAAAAGWSQLGVPVMGCSLAAVTARRLEAATGIPSSSITRLLHDARRDGGTGSEVGLPTRVVVVVDEASMVGTRDLAALAVRAGSVGGKLVLVGDPEQLPEVEAGGLFAALAVHARPLSANQRQMHGWERDALHALRSGRVTEAVDALDMHARLVVGDDPLDARRQLVTAYGEQRWRGVDPYQTVALASSRSDAARLNRDIRQGLLDARLLGGTRRKGLGDGEGRQFAVGELVMVTRNDHTRSLLNGTRAIVTHTARDWIRLHTETGATVDVPTAWTVEHLDYGYAMTVHKAQGLTVDTAYVYGTAALTQQAGYVALSRGRWENYLFTSLDSLTDRSRGADTDIPARFQRMRDEVVYDAADEITERLSRRQQHVLARDQQPSLQHPSLDPHEQSRHAPSRSDDFGLSR